MISLLILLLFASFAQAFTWQSVTSGDAPYGSSTLLYNNVPFAATSDTLYVATLGGLLIRTPAGDRMWTVADGYLTQNLITAVAISSDGGVWVGSSDGTMARLYPHTRQGEHISPFVNDVDVHEIQYIREQAGQLIVSTDAGISRLRYNTALQQWVIAETYRDFGAIGRNPLVYDIQVIRDTMWVSTSRGLVYGLWNDPLLLSPLSWHQITGFGNGTSPIEVYNVVSLRDTTYIADAYGCHRLDGLNPIQIRNGWVHHIAVWNDTLIMVGNSGIRYVLHDQNIAKDIPYPYVVTTSNKLYSFENVAANSPDTTTSGYVTLTKGSGQWILDHPDTPLYPNLEGATRRSDGTLAVICGGYRERGVNEYDGHHWHFHNRYNEPGKDGFFRQDALTIVSDQNNNLWVGSLGGGLGLFYPDSMQYFDHTAATGAHLNNRANTNETTIPAICFMSNGRVVVANQEAENLNGVVVLPDSAGMKPGWENGTWTHIGPTASLNLPYINRIAIDPWDRVWMGSTNAQETTPQQRLTVYDFKGTIENLNDDETHSYGSESGLPSNLSVQSMVFGANGTLYLAMSGVLYYGQVGENLSGVTFYPLQLPLPATSVTVLASDAVGQVWVGTTNGLALLAADGQSWVTIFYGATPGNPSGLSSNYIGGLQFLARTGELFIENEQGIAILQTPFRQSGQQLGKITPAPNPFINNGSNTMKFGETGLVNNADIRIFTPSGLLIKKLSFLDAANDGWNGRNQSGQRVATGVYFLIVTSPDGKVSRGKVAVITP